MRYIVSILLVILVLRVQGSSAQDADEHTVSQVAEAIDTIAISRIIAEGSSNSEVMAILRYLTDVCGSRLTGSPGFTKAANWTQSKLSEWGLTNVHLDGWGPFGRGWELQRFSANVIRPRAFPVIAYPRAWSPGTNGTVSGDVVYLNAPDDSTLQTFRGKLKGKIVLLSEPRELSPAFEPLATRSTDTQLLDLANAEGTREPPRRTRPQLAGTEQRNRALLESRKLELLYKEGASVALTVSRGDGGNIFVQGAAVPNPPGATRGSRVNPWDPNAPAIVPQVAVAGEHYNRIFRLLKQGEKVRMELNLEVKFFREDSGYNVIGEIPGTDLADEVVMIGAHLDSWHGGTGATDNATGVAVCMEAVRLLQTLDLRPRRTIRIALWGGEEHGLLGSRSYVKRNFVERNPSAGNADSVILLKPAAEKLSVYFNLDTGTGRIRGLYMQGNEAVRPIFRRWFHAIGDPRSFTLTPKGSESTDHVSFDEIGLPAFEFIQDNIEYFTRTWHSTMDLFDRAIEDDLKQNAIVMAVFAYNAAMRDERIPRKR